MTQDQLNKIKAVTVDLDELIVVLEDMVRTLEDVVND